MKIQQNTSRQNFGAIPVTRTYIKRKIPFTPFYKDAQTTMIQLEKRYDIPALKHYARSHPKSPLVTDCLFDLQVDEHTYAFAITTQKTDFDELNPDELLGVCDGRILHSEDKPIFYLQNIETQSVNNPLAEHKEKEVGCFGVKIVYKEKFKDIGRKLLQGLVRVLKHSEIEALELKPIETKRDFYTQLGFKPSASRRDTLELQRGDFEEFIYNN